MFFFKRISKKLWDLNMNLVYSIFKFYIQNFRLSGFNIENKQKIKNDCVFNCKLVFKCMYKENRTIFFIWIFDGKYKYDRKFWLFLMYVANRWKICEKLNHDCKCLLIRMIFYRIHMWFEKLMEFWSRFSFQCDCLATHFHRSNQNTLMKTKRVIVWK